MIEVEDWAELRRDHFVRGASIRELAKRTGHSRNTVRRALRADEPPRFRCPPRRSQLDPFREEIQRLLREEPRLTAVRIRELIAEIGFRGGQTIVNDYVRELRPLYLPRPRTFQRTSYRPAELLQFDLWEPAREIPVGHGQTRRGYVVIACLGYSRAGADVLVFSKRTPDLLAGIAGCLWRLGGLPETLVWDRQSGLHAHAGHPTSEFARFCGELRVDWRFCEPADPQAKGVVERLQGYAETSFEPGRRFANHLDFQEQLDRWFSERANPRLHRTLRCRPEERLLEEREALRPLPERLPDNDERLVVRVPADPHLRFDTCDYSVDPALVGRRVELRSSQREVSAVALDTGELCAPPRSLVRPPPHGHRARARARAEGAPRPPVRARGRAQAPVGLRRPDRMTSATSELAHLFRALKAPAAARATPKLAQRAREEEWSHERFLEAVLEEFDFSFQRSVKKTLVLHLGQLDFLAAKENVVLLGPPGTGKSHLAIALGIRACLAGHRVAFKTATEWVALLQEAQRQERLEEELKRLERIPLLVVDEVGYIPFDPHAANLMFMLVARRYERASMVVTSNKPFSGWGEIFGDDVVAAAMIDRLIHHAEIVSLKGGSYRLKDRDLGDAAPAD